MMELELTDAEVYREIAKSLERIKRAMIDDVLIKKDVKIVEAVDAVVDIMGECEYLKGVFHDFIFDDVLPEEEEIDDNDEVDGDLSDDVEHVEDESDS